tara:strand:- start:5384 stop:5815 length:432 start_codon:yes stop_codon:yes gene_type:complete
MSKAKLNPISTIQLIELPKINSDCQGLLTPIYGRSHVPFAINRIYYIYDIPHGSKRGAHAHRDLQQLLIAISGSFEVIVKDGYDEKSFVLNNPAQGLYIPSMIWRELINFTDGTVCLSLASLPFDENDYIRDYNEYLNIIFSR